MSLIRPPVTATSAGLPGSTRPVDHGASPDDDVGAHATHRRSPDGPVHARRARPAPACRIPWSCRAQAVLRVGVNNAPGERGTGVSHGGSVFQVEGSARRTDDSLQISGAIVAPSDGPSPVQLVDAGHAPHGLGVVRDQYARKIRKTPDHPDGPQLHDGGGPAPALRRLRQRRRPRARRPRVTAHLGRQHPRLLRRRRHVLARERPPRRAAGLAGHQPEPARVRRQRPARLAGRLHGEPGQPGHGHRAQGRCRARRPARPLHGRRRRRAVRARPPAAHARRDLPRRREHAGLEGAPRHPPRPCSRRSSPTSRPWST